MKDTEYQMRHYFQSNHLQEFLAGNHYLLILKVPNDNIVKIQQNKKNPGLNIYHHKMINLVDQYINHTLFENVS